MTQVSETRSPPGTRGSRPSGVAIAAIALALLLATLEVARWRATALTPTGTASEVDAFLRPQPERFYRVEWGGLALPDTLISGD
ncbi:MAG: hypothetical protein ACRD2A_16530, partial [Vicinamibacterales bacterium]